MAKPHSVEMTQERNTWHIRAGHTGYQRLEDPVDHLRYVQFDVENGTLYCEDSLTCADAHDVDRFLHISPDCRVGKSDGGIVIQGDGHSWHLLYDDETEAEIIKKPVSYGYGHRIDAPTVILKNKILGNKKIFFQIKSI